MHVKKCYIIILLLLTASTAYSQEKKYTDMKIYSRINSCMFESKYINDIETPQKTIEFSNNIYKENIYLNQSNHLTAHKELRHSYSDLINNNKKYITNVNNKQSIIASNSLKKTKLKAENQINTTKDEWQRKLYVKINAISLLMIIANAAIEVDCTEHLSISIPIYYSAWNYFTSSVKFCTLAIQPELRYWFNENNEHWFAGFHLGCAQYNFAFGGKYRIQEHNESSPAWGGGLSVGYRMPFINNNNRWKMEFSLGAGLYNLHYDKFRNEKNGLLTSTKKKTCLCLDQTNVSFIYTFDLNRKGGKK